MCLPGSHKISHVLKDPQFYRYVLAMIFLIIVLYFEGVAMAYTDNRAQDQGVVTNKSFYLADLGQQIVRDVFGPNFQNRVEGFNDYVTVSVVAATVLFIFFCHVGQRLRLFTRYALCVAILYFIRGLLIFTTVSPQAQYYKGDEEHGCHYFHSVLYAPFQMAFSGYRTCYDTFISGHMFNVVFSALLWSKYYLPTSPFLKSCTHFGIFKLFWAFFPLAVWILVPWNAAFILALQLHYTTDVGIATVLAFLVFFLSLREVKLGEGIFGWFEPLNSIYRDLDHHGEPSGTERNNIQHNNQAAYGMV